MGVMNNWVALKFPKLTMLKETGSLVATVPRDHLFSPVLPAPSPGRARPPITKYRTEAGSLLLSEILSLTLN